jgi:hypothetical protein
MQKTTFLFQLLTGFVAGLFLYLALYGIGQLSGLINEFIYVHNFFVIALLFKAFLFTRYKIFSSVSILTCIIICIYNFYDNPWLSYRESLNISISIVTLLGITAITSPNWKRALLNYGLTWFLLILLMSSFFVLERYENGEHPTSENSTIISYTTKSHNYLNPKPFFLPMYYYDTSSVKIRDRYFTKADLKDKITIMGFGSKVNFPFSYSWLYGFLSTNREQYHNLLQIVLVDVGYDHSIEKTFDAKIYPCRANQRGSYISCEDSLFLFAHDKNAAFVKSMRFKPIPLVIVFDRDGSLIYEITDVANEESARVARNLLEKVIKSHLGK